MHKCAGNKADVEDGNIMQVFKTSCWGFLIIDPKTILNCWYFIREGTKSYVIFLCDYKIRMTRNESNIDTFDINYAESRIMYHHNKKNSD